MSWLLWREYRLNRLIAFVGLALMLLPYAQAAGIALYRTMRGWGTPHMLEAIGAVGMYSIGLSQLVLVLLGGNAIAGERADRSAEFVAHLPISRMRRLVSKLGLSSLAAGLIWGANASVLLVVAALLSPLSLQEVRESLLILGMIAVSSLVAYCVAWLISSVQSSPTFAICAGLVAPLVVFMVIQAVVVWLLEINHPGPTIGIAYVTTCLIISIVSFTIGTTYFLRRVEP